LIEREYEIYCSNCSRTIDIVNSEKELEERKKGIGYCKYCNEEISKEDVYIENTYVKGQNKNIRKEEL
jgi:hypothetical protein